MVAVLLLFKRVLRVFLLNRLKIVLLIELIAFLLLSREDLNKMKELEGERIGADPENLMF